MLVDTHCHLADAQFDPDRPAVVERAQQRDVGHIVVVADSLEGTHRALQVALTYGYSATAGVHPHEASCWTPQVAASVEAAAADPAVVAIGETGLDYHYDHSPRERQRQAFLAQLALAARLQRPLVVHAREADDDVVAILRDAGSPVVLHSFSSGPAVFQVGMDIGAYFSFSGMVTFRNWTHADFVRDVPAERLLVETDAPYLAPVPHRGRRNEPSLVREVAARVAELRGIELHEMARQTTANAARVFGDRVLQGRIAG